MENLVITIKVPKTDEGSFSVECSEPTPAHIFVDILYSAIAVAVEKAREAYEQKRIVVDGTETIH